MLGEDRAVQLWSDNSSGVAPEILQALHEANTGRSRSYGEDAVTARLRTRFAEIFETPVAVFPVVTSTAASAAALALLTPAHGAIFCHPDADVHTRACGAPEFYTGGAKLLPIEGAHGKCEAATLRRTLDALTPHSVHRVRPAALTIAQATECGTVYAAAEIAALTEVARGHDLGVHMDGARFANACARLRRDPADLTWRVGVDVLSFGATNNGAMGAEAVVVFRPELAQRLGHVLKRAGHMPAKMRFVSAQLEAYVGDELWLRNAAHANAMARRLADGLVAVEGTRLIHPVESNAVFAELPQGAVELLEQQGFGFSHRPDDRADTIRVLTAFDTRAEDVDALIAALVRNTAATRRVGLDR